MTYEYDIIVIGGGHAGCEAACAAANLGSRTLLLTADMNRVAQMSCNPAVGGIAKGQIVREIDALGGQMGIITDLTAIQFRMLNRSKGPAVWSPRAQSDRTAFIDQWRKTLDETPNLSIFQDMAVGFIFDDDSGEKRIRGVKTSMGLTFYAKGVVLTVGTFLNGMMHVGGTQFPGGRLSEPASYGLTEQLKSIGFTAARMKTGTPVRIDGRSVDFSLCEPQSGDDEVNADGSVKRDFHKFSFLPEVSRRLKPRECYILHTNETVHSTLRDNLDKSPLYNGQIKSIGPRYCPSIETKIVTFSDKDSHQLFLEPEGETTQEYYLNGFSSSLPWEVQFAALEQIPAFRDIEIYRPGYAIEYDFFEPTQLKHSLETKLVNGLFFAGQINGNTGYEEAAGQGLMAGINAHRRICGLDPLVLKRDQAYIGVLIDDLVTKGVDEPYRMFTSRAEYRILLRQDDADMRLTPIGKEMGLVDDHRYSVMIEKRDLRDSLIEWGNKHLIKVSPENNEKLASLGTSALSASIKVCELLKRPGVTFENLAALFPAVAERLDRIDSERRAEVVEAAEILVKYSGYIAREEELAEKSRRLEYVKLPERFDYSQIKALSTEARQKLQRVRPATIGQASRIPGVSPADVNVLLLLLNR
jgi:tRNA uridine 5-carboxymethylaminomethyl modification enzyme